MELECGLQWAIKRDTVERDGIQSYYMCRSYSYFFLIQDYKGCRIVTAVRIGRMSTPPTLSRASHIGRVSSHDPRFYRHIPSTTTNFKNKLQSCMALFNSLDTVHIDFMALSLSRM